MSRSAATLLLAAIAAVYWPVLGGGYVYDDATLVVRNAALQADDLATLLTAPLFGVEHGYWRPLTSLLLWLGHTVGGAAGIHALALLLHAAAVLVAFAVGRRLLGDARAAFATALLFALHPVQVESVAWCSAINDPLWGLCALLAVQAALRWRDRGGAGIPWQAGVCCLAAMLAKENAVVALPLVLAALAWAPPAAAAVRWRPMLRTLGAATVVWWTLRALAFGELTAGLLRAPAEAPPDGSRLASAPAELLLRHLGLLLQPFPLTPFREFAPAVDPRLATGLLVVAAVLVLGATLGWRRLAPPQRLAVALVVLPLVPVLLRHRAVGAYPIADRYLYLPVFGFALLLASAVARRRWHWVPLALAIAAAPLSFAQTWVWHDQASLVRHAVRWSPEDPNVLVMAGDEAQARAQAGDAAALSSAQRDYRLAETGALRASVHVPHRALAGARLGLAWCLLIEQGGRRGPGTPQLVAAFQRAVDTDPTRPAAWVGLGVALAIAEQAAAAEAAFGRALAIDPDHAEAKYNLDHLRALQQKR